MVNLELSIRKTFIKTGLLLGIILLALSIFSFYFITVITKSPVMFVAAPLIFSLIVPIALVVICCLYGRKKIGGYWNLRQATTGIFFMFFVAYVIQTVGRDFIFAKFIEPNMIEKTEVAFINASVLIKKQPGANQRQIDKNIEDAKKNFQEQKKVTIGGTIQGIGVSIIFIFVLAVIFGALFKKDIPVYSPQIDSRQ